MDAHVEANIDSLIKENERLVAENKQLRLDRERLLTISDSTIDLVAICNYKGQTLYINNACRKTLGIHNSAPLTEIDWEDHYSPSSVTLIKEEVLPYILENGFWKGYLTIKSKNSKEIPVSHIMLCKKDANGRVEYFASIARDISDVKKAQREIDILARIPEEMLSPIMRIDQKGIIVFSNAASDLLLKVWKTSRGGKLPKIWVKIVNRILATGHYKEYEVDCGHKTFDLKLVPVAEHGYVNIFGNDVTHKKKAEKQLIASEKKYRAVVEDQTELIIRFLGDSTVTFANNAYCRYFGLKQDEIIGKKMSGFLPPVARKKFLSRLATLNNENPVITYSQEIKENGITVKWQMWTDRAIYDNNGLFFEFQSVGRDVTQLKEAENEIKKQSLFLRQIIDAIPSLVYVKDTQGNYLMGNKAFADFIGADVNHLSGLKDILLFPGKQGEQYVKQDEQVIEQNSLVVIPEDRVESEGKIKWFQTIKAPLSAPGSTEKQVLGVSTDITKRKEYEEALRFQLEFKELISSISTRFINISHNEIDHAISESLELIGKYIDVDRMVIMRLEGSKFHKRYAWVSEYCKDDPAHNLPIDISNFSWEMEQVSKNGFLFFPDLTKSSIKRKTLRTRAESFAIKSMLLLPLQSKNSVFGYLAVSNVRNFMNWGNDSIALLKIAAQIFSGAIARKAIEEHLNFRVEFENIITNISATFINIAPQNIDNEINATLQLIGNFLNIDQGNIYLLGPEPRKFLISHSWVKETSNGNVSKAAIIKAHEHVWIFKQLARHGILFVPGIKTLPASAENLKKLMRRQGIRSMVCVSIKYGGIFKGALAFSSGNRENLLPEEAIPLLKILGQVFANALERKQIEENLTETKELYRTLASNIPKSAVLLFDNNLRYRLVEGAALEEQGYSKENIEGKTIYQVLPVSSRRNILPMYKDALLGKESIFERAFNGKHYLIHILPVKNDQGEIYAGMVMSMDISDLKEIQKKLEDQTTILRRSNEDLEMFAYAASHDLQEPLRMISTYVYLIQRNLGNQLTGDLKEFMNFTIDGVKRMQQLINDLLEYSRVDRKVVSFQEIDMNGLIEMVKINLKTIIENANAEIICKPLPIIVADQSQIISLFQNLVENAVKFCSGEKCIIEIGGQEFNSKYRFYVKDNGIGIEDKYFERIFIIFQRLNSRKEYQGTGLGLAICKKIAERHGGKIWLKSIPGKGTTFYVEIAK